MEMIIKLIKLMVKWRWERLGQKECQTNGFSEGIGLFLFVVSSLATFVVTQICKESLTKVDPYILCHCSQCK